MGDARPPWGSLASLWQGMGHAGSQEGCFLGEAPQAPAQHRCREQITQARGRVTGARTSQHRRKHLCVHQQSRGRAGSAPPRAVRPRAPIGVSPLGGLGESAKRVGACVDPRALALPRSSRCRSGLLLISVWKENGCCSCKIIPNPSRLSSARQRRAGARVRLPARLVATG